MMSMNTNIGDDLDDIVNVCMPSTYMWCQVAWFHSIMYGSAKHDFSNVRNIVSNPFSCKMQIYLFNQNHAKFLMTLNGKI